MQSHVHLGVFFSENPQILADAKELSVSEFDKLIALVLSFQ